MTRIKRRVEDLERRIGTDTVTMFVYDKDTEAKAKAAIARGDSGTLIVQSEGHDDLIEAASDWHIVTIGGIDLEAV